MERMHTAAVVHTDADADADTRSYTKFDNPFLIQVDTTMVQEHVHVSLAIYLQIVGREDKQCHAMPNEQAQQSNGELEHQQAHGQPILPHWTKPHQPQID